MIEVTGAAASKTLRVRSSLDACAYAVGLFGTSAVLWLAQVAVMAQMAPTAGTEAAIGRMALWSWLLPLPYLLAWFALATPSILTGLCIFSLLAAGNVFLAGFGVAVGFATAGLGAPFAVVAAGGASGLFAASLQTRMVPTADPAAWYRVHGWGGASAGAGLVLTSLLVASNSLGLYGGGWTTELAAGIGAMLALGFVPHAAMAWRRLRAEGRPGLLLPRAAALLALAYLAPAAALGRADPKGWTPDWPVRLLAAEEARTAAAVEGRAWGGQVFGRVLEAGEGVVLRFGGVSVTTVVPTGWVGRVDAGTPGAEQRRDRLLVRRTDAKGRRAAGLLTRVEVGRSWADIRVFPSPGAATPDGRPRRWPDLCHPAGPDGLIRCRSARDLTELKAATAEASAGFGSIGRHGILVDFLPRPPSGGFLIALGPGFRAGCIEVENCNAEFRFGGSAEVVVTFPARHLHRWREVRAEADALLRAATGHGLDEAPAVIQEVGREVLPLVPR